MKERIPQVFFGARIETMGGATSVAVSHLHDRLYALSSVNAEGAEDDSSELGLLHDLGEHGVALEFSNQKANCSLTLESGRSYGTNIGSHEVIITATNTPGVDVHDLPLDA